MLPDRISNPGPLTYESGALPIALRGPVLFSIIHCDLALEPSQRDGSNEGSQCIFWSETVLIRGHNVFFCGKIRKTVLNCPYYSLFGAVT